MSYFLKSGNTFRVSSKEAMDLHDSLPVGNYLIKSDPFENLYLEQIENFSAPSKIYGDCLKNTDRIINTFLDRNGSTGVMLTGEKGSGKTLLSKNISIKLAEQNIPTIVINAPWCGDKFNTFIQTIEQPCAVVFDEFEKVYDSDQQQAILTLMDGIFTTKKLFLLTCNDKWRVDAHMRNRPGRIYYMIDFRGLTQEFIREYCEDNLKNLNNLEGVCTVGSVFSEFNFDMLKAVVEEMNRYNETAQDAISMLNTKPEFDDGSTYKVSLIPVGRETALTNEEHDVDVSWSGNPLSNRQWNYGFDPSDDDSSDEWYQMRFMQRDLKHVEAKNGKFTFVNDRGDRMVMEREKKDYNVNWAF